MSSEDALQDFLQRIEHYTSQYQTLSEELESHLSFMKVFNTGETRLSLKYSNFLSLYVDVNGHDVPIDSS